MTRLANAQTSAGRHSVRIAGLVLLLSLAWSRSAPLTPGNLILERVGDGAAPLSSTGTPVFLQEFTTNGTPVQTNLLPLVSPRPTSNPFNLLDSGSATSDGNLSRSADGRVICIPGYNGTNGEAGIASSVSTTVFRVIGTVESSGTIDTSRAANIFSGGNFRGVTSSDGTNFWATGQPGLAYFQGGVANVLTNSNVRCVRIFDNQLYVSSGAASDGIGVSSIGTGLPTNSPVSATLLLPVGGANPSPYGFEFNPAMTVAYVADDRNNAAGGIIKFTNSGSAWVSNYTLATIAAANVGARGLAVVWSGANPVIYTTTSEASANRLVRIIDTGSASGATTLAAAPANTAFRGLAFTPLGSSAVTPPEITSIKLSGGNVLIDFTGGTSDNVTNFTVLSTLNLSVPMSPLLASISTSGPGKFLATIPIASPAAYYRIRR
jgi:hypothetical protein